MFEERLTTNFLKTLQLVYVLIRAKPEDCNNLPLLRVFDKYISDNIVFSRKIIINLMQDLSFIENLEFRKSITMYLRK